MPYTIRKEDVKKVRHWTHFGAQLGVFWGPERRPRRLQKALKTHIVYIGRLVAERARQPPPQMARGGSSWGHYKTHDFQQKWVWHHNFFKFLRFPASEGR